MSSDDSIGDVDLQAYVDDQLDVGRRLEVEYYLAGRPEAAAEVMAMLRLRDALRLSAAATGAAPEPLRQAAVRLNRGLQHQARWRRLQRVGGIAAAVMLLLTTVVAVVTGILPPGRGAVAAEADFIDDALDARRALLARQQMVSQLEAPDFNPEELQAVAGIVLPPLPTGWTIVDAQLYPWDEGYSLAMAVEVAGIGRVSLFVAPEPTFGGGRLRSGRAAGESVIYWQRGAFGYALAAPAPEPVLLAAARQLSG